MAGDGAAGDAAAGDAAWARSPAGVSYAALAAATPLLPVLAGPPPAHDPDGAWHTLAAYTAPGATLLDEAVARIARHYRTPHRAAVAYASRWLASRIAHAVVFPLVLHDCAVLPTPDRLWMRHADWIDGLAVEPSPFVALDGARDDGGDGDGDGGRDGELDRRAMTWLVELAAPLVEALCRRATIAERQHWAAVADGVAEACVQAGEITGERDRMWDVCGSLLDLASPPFALRPRRFVLDHDGALEAAVVKAQCDLAYLDGTAPRHFCIPCPIVKDAERRVRMIEERLHPH